MKRIVVFAFSVLTFSCNSYKEMPNEVYFIRQGSALKYNLPPHRLTNKISSAIDSLNLKDFKIPKLLDSLYVDYEYNKAFMTYDQAISTRRFIINRVYNIKALYAISSESKYSRVSDPKLVKQNYPDFIYQIPCTDLSIKQLAEKRIIELENW